MFSIQTLIGSSTPAPTAQLHVPPHCGQMSCAHYILISELPWEPNKAMNRTAQSRTQRTIQACTVTMKTKTPGRLHLFVWMTGLSAGLDWPVSISPPQVNVCFLSRARTFLNLRSGLHFISIWPSVSRRISPPNPSERTHHSSSGYSAACFSPLWPIIMYLPGPELNFILPVIKVNSLHSPFLMCSGGINLTKK